MLGCMHGLLFFSFSIFLKLVSLSGLSYLCQIKREKSGGDLCTCVKEIFKVWWGHIGGSL